ncbi:hypothetical protein NLU13_2061 [Sarocladium strictum]|uniref:Helicase C-terminal domain-containing protein n=1 Tax=Sarocladium strictum TaxID=5046 RepID=A0AA39LCC2_SARSR|nr:hypothetical protein NLU13_2061 [Sarocladium strictum]
MAPLEEKYLAVGCISITREESGIAPADWGLENLREWAWLSRKGEFSVLDDAVRLVDPDVQNILLKTPSLANCARLLRASWARLEFKVGKNDDARGTIRVHLLPDDVDRRIVDRANSALSKARRQLLQDLDVSAVSWEHGMQSAVPATDALFSTRADGGDTTLLQLFNEIPPPNPDPDMAPDPFAQDAIVDLLDSRVSGLITPLYHYQRRSAALMCQKEVHAEMTPDPRLIQRQDHNGTVWYIDPVSGSVLRERRSYDGIRGGILAEEMGLGKTIICLALILATRHLPTLGPDIFGVAEPPTRHRIASLADMAASCTTRNGVPWKPYLDAYQSRTGDEFSHLAGVLSRNPGFYNIPPPELRRAATRRPQHSDMPIQKPKKIYLSNGSLVIVPNNLVAQWKQEINKHTEGLKVLYVALTKTLDPFTLLSAEELLKYDVILFSQGRFEKIGRELGGFEASPLTQIHFKRCIVDEGHKLGNSRMGNRSVLLMGLDMMRFSSRWIVTGTPSHGLYGTDESTEQPAALPASGRPDQALDADIAPNEPSTELEKKDLERIGAIAALYLKARPWCNSVLETGDTPAEWSKYVMLPKHDPKGCGNWGTLRSTLNSLIIRHPRADVGDLLPEVHERLVVLEPSFQDKLSLNLFSMMIIFNAVQSERKDLDYFFHPKQKKHVLQIVSNMKQSSFFGGSFFSRSEIMTSVETAEKFLEERKVPVTDEDETLLRDAIKLGHIAAENKLRMQSNEFHEMPLGVEGFPGRSGPSWSLSGEGDPDRPISTSASLLLALQRLVFETAGAPEALNSLLNGGLVQEGIAERHRILTGQALPATTTQPRSETLAGNTKLGNDSPRKSRSHGINGVKPKRQVDPDAFRGPLELTKITATVSAKLSYLIDSIVEHQEEDKIIIFYENENVAWYLSATLDVLQIQHLIYARGLSTERRAQYVNTFHNNPTFRVLLMDLSQAAFGLDMREASRVYFINPVLNPQVEAQAIGRVRRIHQKKPVYVETLVLKDSIDEVILERKEHMTQAEHRQVKSILDIRPIYNWIKNAKISPLPDTGDNDASQMAGLRTPHNVFGRGFGQRSHPDDGLVLDDSPRGKTGPSDPLIVNGSSSTTTAGLKRGHVEDTESFAVDTAEGASSPFQELAERPARRVRFAGGDDD